jgi:polysaccharide export outer membrane protein
MIVRILSRAFAAMIVLAIVACTNSTPPLETDTPKGQLLPVPDTTVVQKNAELRVAPGDAVEVRVFGIKDLSGRYEVDDAGRVDMPLIGFTDVRGLSAGELATHLEQQFGAKYLQNPQITASVISTQISQITVEGSVQKPGLYPIKGRMTLLQAVALAGGPTEAAEPENVYLFREVNGERVAGSFDLLKIRSGGSPDPIVYGNDVVIMDGDEARAAFNDILKTLPLASFLLFL